MHSPSKVDHDNFREVLPFYLWLSWLSGHVSKVDSLPLVPGLTYKKLNRLEEGLDCFLKLHAILRNSAQVMFQLAHLYPSDSVFACFYQFVSQHISSRCWEGVHLGNQTWFISL